MNKSGSVIAQGAGDVSVVVPAYNAGKYIGDTLESVLRQTHKVSEVIVVDDGSTDDTSTIVRSFGARIRLITQPNSGVASACNAGVALSTGEHVAFVDADDIWEPRKIEVQLRSCAQHVISHTDSVCFGDGISEPIVRSSFEPQFGGDVLQHLLVRNFITKSTVMVRRDEFLRFGGFPEGRHGVEDWPLWLRLCGSSQLGYVPEPLARYRVHALSKSMKARETMADHIRIIEEAFGSAGVGERYPHLKREALTSSYSIHCHYAGVTGDWAFALKCGVRLLGLKPGDAGAWKHILKSLLIPMGRAY